MPTLHEATRLFRASAEPSTDVSPRYLVLYFANASGGPELSLVGYSTLQQISEHVLDTIDLRGTRMPRRIISVGFGRASYLTMYAVRDGPAPAGGARTYSGEALTANKALVHLRELLGVPSWVGKSMKTFIIRERDGMSRLKVVAWGLRALA